MNSRFKNIFNRVKADEEIVNKTEKYLENKFLSKKYENPIQKIMFKTIKAIDIRKLAISACFAVLLIVGGAKVYATPQSYVNLDINPSVELGINLFGQVVTLEAYNEDGYTILDGVDVTGKNVMAAVKILVDSAADHGFIADDGSTIISITAQTNNEANARELNADADAGLQQALKENGKSAKIFMHNVDLPHRAEARQNGITPGKLYLIRKLQAIDPNASIDQYRYVTTKDIMKTIEAKKDKDKNITHSQNLETSAKNQKDNAPVGNQNYKAEGNPSSSAGNLNENAGKDNENSKNARNGNNTPKESQEKGNKDDLLKSQNLTDEEGYQKETSPIKDENVNAKNSNQKSNAENGNKNTDAEDSSGDLNAENDDTNSEALKGDETPNDGNSDTNPNDGNSDTNQNDGNSKEKSNAGQGEEHKDNRKTNFIPL